MIFDSSPEPRNSISLAKLATIFAITFCVAFGLCSVSLGASEKMGSFLMPASLIVEAICAIGLIVIGIIAFARSVRR